MANYDEYYKARNIISDILKKDLIGPVLDDEILCELPTNYYIMGKLYPQGNCSDDMDTARTPVLENEINVYDASISLSNQRDPSSIGITCTLKKGITKILVCCKYAFYAPVSLDEAEQRNIDLSKWVENEKKIQEIWQRQQYENKHVVELGNGKISKPISLEGGMRIQVFIHTELPSGEKVITATLINDNKIDENNGPKDKARLCAFQTEIKLTGIDNEVIFSDTDRKTHISTDKELQNLALLYSDVKCYAQGHGCSAVWDMSETGVRWVASAWMPEYNLLQMKAATRMNDRKVLSMKYLSTADSLNMLSDLRSFANSYHDWIKSIKNKIKNIKVEFQDAAKINIENCSKACQRIFKAIDLLEKSYHSDQQAIKAFKLMNEAMLLQRKQTLIKAKKDFDEDKITWYPFQLAFILHELSSFINPEDEERNVVDLLWFPTGGGKTEAYLGITAFVIFLRRIRDSKNDGVTVIMRYTLRLLTLQQFERSTMLICACELLRRKYDLGGKEFSIGLWVGENLTPNHLKDAVTSIRKQQSNANLNDTDANPCQIQVCPWCGKPITAQDYSVDSLRSRMIIKCSDPDCAFHNLDYGLPVHIIDEAIYKHLPSFIVATVDKFAQIPLKAEPAVLFGISKDKNPPDLIIQDELHLISGPLGTMTGIYEAAITKICERNGIGAKVIASTATIRNAEGQIRALYGKKYTQFPPQGISAKDSYFAVESTSDDRPNRKYLGVMGIGVTATTTLIRINAALLFATRYLSVLGFKDSVIDNFWTITDYFNSLRELGGASTQILDDVQSRFSYLAKTKFKTYQPSINAGDKYDNLVELTSRMNNSEITRIIQDKLKRSYRDNGYHTDVFDFVLASNMISVGVDVGRLGIMVVAGQPKTNAEYIQASSRVGRENPGLVVVAYNPTRSRDRSHYEQFLRYHSGLYKYVEATSLTPFADRARDRGLHALYVSLCRYLVPELLKNDAASKFRSDDARIENIKNIILEYVKNVDPVELNNVENELDDIADEWEWECSNEPDLVYRGKNYKKDYTDHELLKDDIEDSRFRTMNSMRNVDVQAGIYLLRG